MRIALAVALSLTTLPGLALADDATPATATSQTVTPANPDAPETHAQVVGEYPAEIAQRQRAIGAGLAEAAIQAGAQINPALGFGEIPMLRYGLTDSWELNLLGARYIVAEDGHYIPGLSVRAQIHDLAYQRNTTLNYNYPALRPGLFFEFRDRLPFALAVNGEIGYVVTVQAGSTAPDGTPINAGTRIPAQEAPLQLELQWSPLEFLSFAGRGGYLADTSTPAYSATTQSDAFFQVAAIYNSNRFDVRVYFQSNWFANNALGYVPEVGGSVSVRL